MQVNTGSIVLWVTQHNNADLGCFRTLILQGTLTIQNQHQEVSCVFSEFTSFVPRSWMCKKQTSVSHSSTESEINFLDAGLRMDGIPALTLWDLVIEVFHSVPNKTDGPKRESHQETRRQCSSQTCITPSQSSTPTSFQQTLITFHQIQRILIPVPCCMSLRTTRR